MDFNSSFMELPKSSSALSSEMQRPIHMDSSMPSDKKIQQDEDERDPRFMQLLKENLFSFWKRQKEEILRSDPKRKHDLPISRIRRAMKSNDQVKMVSAHSTVLFSKAIEMFILDLTLRAWMQADQVKRQTLKRSDFARAIRDEELFDFLSDIVPLQTHKFQVEEANDVLGNKFCLANQMVQPHYIPVRGEENDGQGNGFDPADNVQPNNIPVQAEANDGQGNEFHPTYQMGQPNNIPVEEEANGGQGNEFHPAGQMVQPNNIPASFISNQGILAPLINLSPEPEFNIGDFLMEEANDVQGNKFHLANQMVQPHNIPLQQLYQFQVRGEENDGQGNEFDPASNVQPNNIPVQAEANDGQGNELHPTYQMDQPNNIPVEEEANDGQGNEFYPAGQMVQPNNIPTSFISIQGIPAPLMLPPLNTLSPEPEFNIDDFLLDYEEEW